METPPRSLEERCGSHQLTLPSNTSTRALKTFSALAFTTASSVTSYFVNGILGASFM
jgi:hypothetical protein